MTATPTNVDVLVERYFEIWNETDAEARRALIAQTWSDDSVYVDPLMSGEGREGIDAMIAGFQAHATGVTFRRTGDVDAHHDRIRFSWEGCQDGGDPLAGGVDFGVVTDGRLQSITGFLDFAPDTSEQ